MVLIVCEADTLRRTHTAADGAFALTLPTRLVGSKLIAAMPWAPPADTTGESQASYYPHYFAADSAATVLLRPLPVGILGEPMPEPDEFRSSPIVPYLQRQRVAVGPPPQAGAVRFGPPASDEHR